MVVFLSFILLKVILQPSLTLGQVNENQELMFNSLSNNQEFSKLIKLFRNPAVFGSKLLDKTKELLLGAQYSEDFLTLTEILIRAHDCFAQSCSMEGISNVLQVSKECAHRLEKVGEFNIMARKIQKVIMHVF
jgi:spatacsin